MFRLLCFFPLLVFMLCNYSCQSTQGSTPQQHPVPRQQNPVNIHNIDSCVRLLHSGYIALRTGADPISYMLRQMNENDQRFSHCGIVMVEEGIPYVYHSIGGEDNPEAMLQKAPAATFFNAYTNERIGIAQLDLNNQQIIALTQVVRHYYQQKVLFDMDFDLADSSRFYCSEFVYRSVRHATKDTGYFKTSVLNKQRFVGIDDIFASPHGGIICDVPFK